MMAKQHVAKSSMQSGPPPSMSQERLQVSNTRMAKSKMMSMQTRSFSGGPPPMKQQMTGPNLAAMLSAAPPTPPPAQALPDHVTNAQKSKSRVLSCTRDVGGFR